MKFKTVYENERALVTKYNGTSNVIEGPRRIFVCLDKVEKLEEFVADVNQYLLIRYLNGNIAHVRGPTRQWSNRLEHESIRIERLVQLKSSQMIIVYARDNTNSSVVRRLVPGPCVFMPEPNEWLHTFTWHGSDPNNIGHLVPNLAKFTLLTIQPDFFHYYIKEVRTLDDTLLTVKMMVIFEIKDIYLMLDMTQDPISDFINAICADVVSFVGKLTFEDFLKESSKLNNLENHPQLLQRAERIGYSIRSVIYNGYHSSDALQDIQDNAIQSRTMIRLNTEINNQKQEIIDLKLKCETKQFDLLTKLNKLKYEFTQKLNDKKTEHKILIESIKNENEIKLKNYETEVESEVKKSENAVESEYLDNLKKLNVDVSAFKIESAKAVNQVDTRYEIVKA